MTNHLKGIPVRVKEELNLPFTFKYTTLGSSILTGFQEQRQDDFLVDVSLKCGAFAIRAHKVFLAAFAAYFRALFKFEPSCNEFELHDVDGPSLSLLIDYAYSGELVITGDNVQDILQMANFINHEPVCDACCTYLKKNLCPESCFDIMQLATSLDRTQLRNDAKLYMLEHFEEISKSDQFLAISPELLKEYLNDDELVVCENGFLCVPIRQDELVKEAVCKYVNFDTKTRSGLLPELLSLAERSTEGRFRFRTLPELKYKNSRCLAETFHVRSEMPPESFNDIDLASKPEVLSVTGMKIYLRMWDGWKLIGGILVYYSNGKSVLHGADNYGLEEYEFHINQDERIVHVKCRAGWMIGALSFTTNTGRIFGPYGLSDGGEEYELKPPTHVKGGYLVCFAGGVDVTEGQPAYRRMVLTWGYYSKKEDEDHSLSSICVQPCNMPAFHIDGYPYDYGNFDVEHDGEDDPRDEDVLDDYPSGESDYDPDLFYVPREFSPDIL